MNPASAHTGIAAESGPRLGSHPHRKAKSRDATRWEAATLPRFLPIELPCYRNGFRSGSSLRTEPNAVK